MGLLDGRAVVVTSAAHGIGLEVARAPTENGSRVVIGDVDGAAVVKAVANPGGPSVAVITSSASGLRAIPMPATARRSSTA